MPKSEITGVRWISNQRDIRSLRRIGDLVRTDCLLAWIAPGRYSDGDAPRVAVVAGRGFKNAVSRNRARRRVRGCVLDSRDSLEPGCGYLFECRPCAGELDYQKLVIALKKAISDETEG